MFYVQCKNRLFELFFSSKQGLNKYIRLFQYKIMEIF